MTQKCKKCIFKIVLYNNFKISEIFPCFQYMKSQAGPSSKELTSVADLIKFTSGEDFVVIGQFDFLVGREILNSIFVCFLSKFCILKIEGVTLGSNFR